MNELIIMPLLFVSIMSCGIALCGLMLSHNKTTFEIELMSHAALPGMTLGLLYAILLNISNDVAYAVIIMAVSVLYFLFMKVMSSDILSNKFAFINASGSFGLASIILFEMKKHYPIYASLPERYVYGGLLAVKLIDVIISLIILILLIVFLVKYRRQLMCIMCDRDFAILSKINVKAIEFMLMLLSFLAILYSIIYAGIVMTSSVAIVPAVSARLICRSFNSSILFCSFFGLFLVPSTLFAVMKLQSFYGLNDVSLLSLTSLAICTYFTIAIIVGSRSSIGIFYFYNRFKMNFNIAKEDTLKFLYNNRKCNMTTVSKTIKISMLYAYLIRFELERKSIVRRVDEFLVLTKKGKSLARDIIYKHELIESGVRESIEVSPEVAHDIAEELEHFITDGK